MRCSAYYWEHRVPIRRSVNMLPTLLWCSVVDSYQGILYAKGDGARAIQAQGSYQSEGASEGAARGEREGVRASHKVFVGVFYKKHFLLQPSIFDGSVLCESCTLPSSSETEGGGARNPRNLRSETHTRYNILQLSWHPLMDAFDELCSRLGSHFF